MSKVSNNKTNGGANLGFENDLWAAADKMRGHMDSAEYKHVALGLIFLKYISDAFREMQEKLTKEEYADPEDRDEYKAENVFWVPKEARWSFLQNNAKQPTIGKIVDDAMVAIEKDNPVLKGVLPKDYARPALDKQRLGELIDLISNIELRDKENRSRDILGRVYEYFLGKFANAEGKGGGEFYTPRSVVRLLVAMIQPFKGRIYDPCCGSGGMFVQSERFVQEHGGRIGDLAIYGQESNPTTWKLCKMNLAIRGIEGNIGPHQGDSFRNDLHKDLKADFILANPPFNQKDWGGQHLREDVRWKYGIPPVNNANYAWIQHMIHHLAPDGIAGFVLANGSMSSNTGGEGDIRKAIIEADLVDCMIALPPQLFYTTGIPACLWFLTRSKNNGKYRDRRGKILFIDARKMGQLIDRVHRELSDEEITQISLTYRAWRGEVENQNYSDTAGYCLSSEQNVIRENGFILTPGRYVGSEYSEEDTELFETAMEELVKMLSNTLLQSHRCENQLRHNLMELGFGLDE